MRTGLPAVPAGRGEDLAVVRHALPVERVTDGTIQRFAATVASASRERVVVVGEHRCPQLLRHRDHAYLLAVLVRSSAIESVVHQLPVVCGALAPRLVHAHLAAEDAHGAAELGI